MPMNSNWFNPVFLYLMYSLPYVLCLYLYVARVICYEFGLLLQVGEGKKKKFPSGMCCGSGVMLQVEKKKRWKYSISIWVVEW